MVPVTFSPSGTSRFLSALLPFAECVVVFTAVRSSFGSCRPVERFRVIGVCKQGRQCSEGP